MASAKRPRDESSATRRRAGGDSRSDVAGKVARRGGTRVARTDRGTPVAGSDRDTPVAGAGRGTSIAGIARGMRTFAGTALGIAGTAADLSLQLAAARLPTAGQRAAARSAGATLRRMRESAGLSLKDLGHAIDLDDPALLALVEAGKVALPFEIVLRLTAALGKNDPIAFLLQLTRTHNPEVWATLERLGVGRLVLQAGREREFANIYRASDAARGLSDPEFAAVLEFTRSAFEAAMRFRDELATRGATRPPKRSAARKGSRTRQR